MTTFEMPKLFSLAEIGVVVNYEFLKGNGIANIVAGLI